MDQIKQKWILNPRQRCDLELLLVGGFEPLKGFLSQTDYENVVTHMRLANGTVWPMPITLDVNEGFAETIQCGEEIGLCDVDNTVLAKMLVTDKWAPDRTLEAQKVFGSDDKTHPGVNYLLNHSGSVYLGGPITLIKMPSHFDFPELRYSPESLKKLLSDMGWKNIIGFQTRNPMHRAHMELTLRAAEQIDGNVLIHPIVGLTKPGDIDYYTRVRCYQKVLHHYPTGKALLSLLPLAMRMGGPREALWHALIRKNYGCTHFIVGRDHAGPGNDSHGKPFYDPYAAQDMVKAFQTEIGIEMVPFSEMVYVKERNIYCTHEEIKANETALTVSGTQLRKILASEEPIPSWFSFPDVIQELRNSYVPKYKQGLTLFFTGLSGAGKTTIAHALMVKMMSLGFKSVSVLDGDAIRRILSNELGFSRKDRDLNIQRIGFVASEITKAGGAVICAAIAPYREARDKNRQMISQLGNYVEVYFSTPIEECEKRDPKGLYQKAKQGVIQKFTGVDDPYEPPVDPEITIDTSELSIADSVDKIVRFLDEQGFVAVVRHEELVI